MKNIFKIVLVTGLMMGVHQLFAQKGVMNSFTIDVVSAATDGSECQETSWACASVWTAKGYVYDEYRGYYVKQGTEYRPSNASLDLVNRIKNAPTDGTISVFEITENITIGLPITISRGQNIKIIASASDTVATGNDITLTRDDRLQEPLFIANREASLSIENLIIDGNSNNNKTTASLILVSDVDLNLANLILQNNNGEFIDSRNADVIIKDSSIKAPASPRSYSLIYGHTSNYSITDSVLVGGGIDLFDSFIAINGGSFSEQYYPRCSINSNNIEITDFEFKDNYGGICADEIIIHSGHFHDNRDYVFSPDLKLEIYDGLIENNNGAIYASSYNDIYLYGGNFLNNNRQNDYQDEHGIRLYGNNSLDTAKLAIDGNPTFDRTTIGMGQFSQIHIENYNEDSLEPLFYVAPYDISSSKIITLKDGLSAENVIDRISIDLDRSEGYWFLKTQDETTILIDTYRITMPEFSETNLSVTSNNPKPGDAVRVDVNDYRYSIKKGTLKYQRSNNTIVDIENEVFRMPEDNITILAEIIETADDGDYTITLISNQPDLITSNRRKADAHDEVQLLKTLNKGYYIDSIEFKNDSGKSIETYEYFDFSDSIYFKMPASNLSIYVNYLPGYSIKTYDPVIVPKGSLPGSIIDFKLKEGYADGNVPPCVRVHLSDFCMSLTSNLFTMPEFDVYINYPYEHLAYEITASTNGYGKIIAPYQSLSYSLVTINAIPNTGYQLKNPISINNGEVEIYEVGYNTYSFKMPAEPVKIEVNFSYIPASNSSSSSGGGSGGGGGGGAPATPAPTTPTTSTVDTVKNTVSNLPTATNETQLTSTDKTNITNAINQVVNLAVEEKAKLDVASIEKLENLVKAMYPTTSSSISNQTTLSAVKATGLALALGIDEISQNNGNVSVGLEVKKATLTTTQEKSLLSQVDPSGTKGSKLLPLDLSIVKTVGGVNSNVTETKVPIQVTITLPAGFDPKGSYVIAREHNGVIEMLQTVNNGDGTISFKSDKFSTYVLVHNNKESKGTDLSYYSNGKFNIYANSRVVYVSEGKDTIYMKGYAFEQFNSFSRKDSFVRELIFLDKNDPSNPNKAYRITLPSVYDPYLNKNKNLNPNGTYNYNYAYYGNWMNLNKVRKYTNPASAPLVSMPKGEYLIYIRMSDGKRSNIMSIKSTKAEVSLPSSFIMFEMDKIVYKRK